MTQIQKFLSFILTKKFFKKLFAYGLLIGFIYAFQDFAFIFFLTFIFAYLFLNLGEHIKLKIDWVIDKMAITDKTSEILKKFFWLNLIIVIEYIIFTWIIILLLSSILPKLVTELTEIAKNLPILTEQVNQVAQTLKEIKQDYSEIWGTITQVITNKDYEVLLNFFTRLKDAWLVFFQIILSLVLSFVFIVDRKKLNKYLQGIKKSNFKFLYNEYQTIFEKIVKSFGLIIKAQAVIAFVNAILTIFWLYIIWLFHGVVFPYILTLWLVVFVFGFIPVLWVFLSSLPIIFIAYTFIWWIEIVIAIIGLIFIVHTVEAYYLNPKIVSSFLDFPVSLTFLILIVSEHIFWFAWLLIWVSLFYFLMWLLKDIDEAISRKKKKFFLEE